MGKYWTSFIIDKVKGTFGNRESSYLESNYHSVKRFVIRNVDGIHDAVKELMKRQKYLILKNNNEIVRQYMELQVINKYFKAMRDEMEFFWFNASYFFLFKRI